MRSITCSPTTRVLPVLMLLAVAVAIVGGACASAPRPRTFELDQVDERPTLTRERAIPQYPPAARKSGVTGHVELRARIDDTGRVVEAKVVKSSPPRVFDAAALDAIRRWRFVPARLKGKPVGVWIRQTIRFSLEH
jgi:TonB family protein